MFNWRKEYEECCNVPSDINEHLPVLFDLCKQCNTTKEFGTALGRSTRAFLAAITETKGRLDSYDIRLTPDAGWLFQNADEDGLNANFHLKSTLTLEPSEVEFLFIDTLHTYDQIIKELEIHGDFVTKYIAFHDVESYGENGEIPNSPSKLMGRGILPAINEWRSFRPEWVTKYESTNNNGLLVIEFVGKS